MTPGRLANPVDGVGGGDVLHLAPGVWRRAAAQSQQRGLPGPGVRVRRRGTPKEPRFGPLSARGPVPARGPGRAGYDDAGAAPRTRRLLIVSNSSSVMAPLPCKSANRVRSSTGPVPVEAAVART